MQKLTIDGVPRDYVLRLTPEAHEVLLGMVELCLNKRFCLGMDEGYKNFADEQDEHDFVKELRALLDAPACKTPSGAACPGDGVGPCKKCKGDEQPQGEPVAWVVFDNGFIDDHTVVKTVADEWEGRGLEVTPLYATPRPLTTYQVTTALHGVPGLPGVSGDAVVELTRLLNKDFS